MDGLAATPAGIAGLDTKLTCVEHQLGRQTFRLKPSLRS